MKRMQHMRGPDVWNNTVCLCWNACEREILMATLLCQLDIQQQQGVMFLTLHNNVKCRENVHKCNLAWKQMFSCLPDSAAALCASCLSKTQHWELSIQQETGPKVETIKTEHAEIFVTYKIQYSWILSLQIPGCWEVEALAQGQSWQYLGNREG